MSEPRAIATGSHTLLARNDSQFANQLRGAGEDGRAPGMPLSDSPLTLYASASKDASRSARKDTGAPPPQSGPPTFTDDPLNDPTNPESFKIKALHITELRSAINSLRQQRGLAPYPWEHSATTSDFISAIPIIEMRAALDQALAAPSGGYSVGLAQGQPVLAIHRRTHRE